MHGMLSSAIILATFALVAWVGGYTAWSLYRAAPGAAARPRPAPVTVAAEDAEADEDPPAPEEDETPEEPAEPEPAEPEPAADTEGARLYVLDQARLPRH
jgi:hypothetical protein